jgi:anti-anti-sigma factor
MADLLLQINHHGDETHVAVIGPIQHATTKAFHNQLRRIIDSAAAPLLVIDLRCCTSIDTHGLLALIAARHATETRGGTLTLIAVPPLIQRQLDQHPQTQELL